MEYFRSHVLVCGGTGCTSSGSETLLKLLEEKLVEHGLDKEIKAIRTGCFADHCRGYDTRFDCSACLSDGSNVVDIYVQACCHTK